MKQRNSSRRILAILLAFFMMFSIIFDQGIVGSASEWNNYNENISLIATDTDAMRFNMGFPGISFLNELQTLANVDAVYDVGDAYYGEHKKTNIYSLNHEIRVYCGDHNKMYPDSSGVSVTISSTEDSSLSAIQKENLRKVLYYNAIYNFEREDDQIAMTHLALDHYKNGNSDYSYASDFIRYIDAAPTVLSGSEARIYVGGTDVNSVQSGMNTHTKVNVTTTTNTPSGQREKRSKLLTLRGADSNSVTVTVPSEVTMWVYSYNASTGKSSYYDKSESGDVTSYTKKVDGGNKVTLNVNDQFLFTASLQKSGNSSIEKSNASKSGYNVMQCYHNDAYQTWYYLGSPQTYSISLEIEWGDAESTAISVRKRTSNENISDNNHCYLYEGAVYDVYHIADKTDSAWGITGTRVGRFIMKDTGTGIAQPEYCKTDSGYNVGVSPQSAYLTNLPYGWYRIQEVKAPSGYRLNKETIIVDLTDGGIDNKYDVTAYDEPIVDPTGIRIYKRDAETGEEVQGAASLEGAEFTIKYYDDFYDKIEDLPKKATRTWVLKTDQDGYCDLINSKYLISEKSDALYLSEGMPVIPLGTITIEESKAPTGYTLNDLSFKSVETGKVVSDENGVYFTQITDEGSVGSIKGGNEYEVDDFIIRGDLEFKKTDEAGKSIANVKFSITDISGGKKGESHIVWTDENGYYSTSSFYIKHSKNTNNGQPGSGIWFGDTEVDDSMGALPYGTYEIQELRCDANKETYKNADPVTVKVEKDAVTVDAGTIIDRDFPLIHTTARDSVTNTHTSSAVVEEVNLIDSVLLSRLDVGHTYTLSTVVMDKETEKVLVVEKGNVKGQTTFTADKEAMTVETDVTFSSKGLDGKDVVFYEYLTDSAYPGEVIARHEDINDPDQTIHFVEIHTTATGENGEKVIYTTKDITMKDVVEYKGLTEGETYTVSGVLMDKETEEEFLSNGEIVTAEVEFVAEAEDGSVEVEFIFSGVNLGVKEIVAFEELRYEDYVLAVHADINDDGQTITTTPNPTIVRKKDATTGEEIPGATLSLYDEEGNLVDTWVSTTVPHGVENLAAGTYRLVEEMAPLGYLMAEDVTFEVLADGTVTEVEIFDSYAIVAITKVDAVTGDALSGAEFTLYDAETDEAVMTAVSDEEGYAEFIKVAPGEYYIKETAFPDGYTVDLSNPDNITYVTVEANQYTNAAPIILFNQYSRVCVYKIDSKTKKALAGAEFTLYDAKTDAVAGKAVSDADGYAEFEDVAPGEYYIKETNAPEGYLISSEKIYIDTSKTNYTMAAPIVMENTPEPDTPDTPHTGDTFPMIPIALAAGLSVIGIIAVLVLKKRKK